MYSKRIPKFSKTFPGIFTVPFSFGPEISVFLVEWKAPKNSADFDQFFNFKQPVILSPIISKWIKYYT